MLDQLTFDIAFSSQPVFITGAGISIASGIPPFRGSADAVWARDVLDMGTANMFRCDPVSQWSWYLQRFDCCKGARPNASHLAISDLQSWKPALRVVTQNVDGLHIAAGTKDVIEIHGAHRRLRCSKQYCPNGAPAGTIPWDESLTAAFRADPSMETLPRCSVCGSVLRPHVLWFDENYQSHKDFQFEQAAGLFMDADLMVFIGTSFSVGITDYASTTASMLPTKVWTIDPISQPPRAGGTWLKARAEEALPQIMRNINAYSSSAA